ncbi:MAG: J domain-containing protein [Methylobacter sp.]|nr:J domain-containing protein [Methylobacter sp.]
MNTTRTHYDNLKVTRDAPVSVIKAAYKALCQNFHPDKFQGNNEEAERVIRLVNASYAVLMDPAKRASHNDWIREQETKQQGGSAKVEATDNAAEPTDYQKQNSQAEQRRQQKPPPSSTDNAKEMLNRAHDLHDIGQYAEALTLYQFLAKQGEAQAQFKVGVMYDKGQYVMQDYAQAVFWYLKAAEQGNSNARYNLAIKYQSGHGVAKDDVQAAYWYRKAAE